MNFKKIFSATLAATIVSSSVVAFASIDDIAADRKPKFTFTVGDQITTAEEYSTATNAADKGEFNDSYNYYPLEITVSDLGELYNTGKKDDAIGISSVYAVLKSDKFVANNGKTGSRVKYYSHADQSQYDAKSITFGQNTVVGREDWFGMTWAAKDGEMYPSYDEENDNTINNATMTFKTVIATQKTETPIEVTDFVLEIGYQDVDNNVSGCYTGVCTNDKVVFGKTTPDPEKNEWNIAIAEEEATDNNKLWKITPEKTGTPDDISKFDITFKAADTSIEPLKKSLRTEVLNKIADSWNTGYNFYIGLKVKTEGITGVTADWDIAAGSSTVNVNK